MQTFLPFKDYQQSARVLDYRRLGKQRLECLQLLNSCLKLKNGEKVRGWANHPARLMWVGYETHLVVYGQIMCEEWKRRGYKDTCHEKIGAFLDKFPLTLENPPWLGDEAFHSSHRAALLHKDFEFYKQWNWSEEPKLDYIWPVKIEKNDTPDNRPKVRRSRSSNKV